MIFSFVPTIMNNLNFQKISQYKLRQTYFEIFNEFKIKQSEVVCIDDRSNRLKVDAQIGRVYF